MSLWFLLYIHMITDDFKNGSIIFFFPGVFRILIALAYWTLLLLLFFLIIHFSSFFFYFKHFYWFILSNCFSNSCDVYSNIWSANIYTYIRACVCVWCVCVCRTVVWHWPTATEKKRKAKIKKTWNISYLVVDWIWFGSVRYIILLLKLCVVTLLLESWKYKKQKNKQRSRINNEQKTGGGAEELCFFRWIKIDI